MSLSKREHYFNSIVQVCGENDVPAGAGVLVDENTIVTCAHVVALACGLSADVDESALPQDAKMLVRRPFVDGASARGRLSRVIRFNGRRTGSQVADVAVLRLVKGTFRIHGEDAILTFAPMPEGFRGLGVSTFGFPDDATDTIDQGTPADYTLRQAMPNGWIFAQAAVSYGQEIRFGFSGSPVLEDASLQLVGLVCEADSNRRTATIIPTQVLLRVYQFPVAEIASQAIKTERVAPSVETSTPRTHVLRLAFDFVAPRLHYFLTARMRLLRDTPERPLLESYLNERKAIWTDELADKTYLPPPAKQLAEAPVQLQRAGSGFFSPIQQLIKEVAGISEGGDSASAQISAVSRRSRTVRNLVRRLRTTDEPLIVLGEPGAGKSMTLKQAAIELCHIGACRVFPELCLFVNLGRWRPIEKPGISEVESLIQEATPIELKPFLDTLKDQGRLVIIFDALDEMSRERYNEHTEALSRYAEKYRGRIRTLFSCRIPLPLSAILPFTFIESRVKRDGLLHSVW